jgi:hypothetical protein
MKLSLLALALTGSMLSAGTAYAFDTVVATYNGVSPGLSNGVRGGVFNFTRTGGTSALELVPGPAGTFIGICLDLGNNISSGTWDVRNLADAPVPGAPMGVTKAADIGKLIQGVLGGALAGASGLSNFNASALQLAVWEIVNETSGTYNLLAGTFIISGATGGDAAVAGQANTYLGMMAATSAANLYALMNDGNQDMLVQAVPIPAAAWLLGSGLLGLFGLARRKTAVATA